MNAPQKPPRICRWCRGAIEGKRRDATTCSQKCRQAASRFKVSSAPPASSGAMRFAYADPPYPGLARRYYNCEEVDHAALVAQLVRDYPDGWALSTSAKALKAILALVPEGTRVCPWFRRTRPTRGYRSLSSWEPLLVYGGRARRLDAEPLTDSLEVVEDVLIGGGRQHSHPGALVGMKPAPFWDWMFAQLGAEQGDTLADLFPGSGAGARAWTAFQGVAAAAPTEAVEPRASTVPVRVLTDGLAFARGIFDVLLEGDIEVDETEITTAQELLGEWRAEAPLEQRQDSAFQAAAGAAYALLTKLERGEGCGDDELEQAVEAIQRVLEPTPEPESIRAPAKRDGCRVDACGESRVEHANHGFCAAHLERIPRAFQAKWEGEGHARDLERVWQQIADDFAFGEA